jgi:lipopolysaccharide export system permease protein
MERGNCIRRYKLVFYYLISEMVPTFFVGVISFVSILLLFQVLKLTDTLLQHDVSFRTLIHLLSYMSISFLPAILPMSLIFAIVLSYNRLSGDSEIIALKSLGMSMWPIIFPGLTLGLVIAILSGYTSFKIGPWGNRQFEVLITDIGGSKPIAQIKEGTFTEFFNMMVYANKVNQDTEELEKVFISDERDPLNPTQIVAEKGKLVSEKSFNSLKALVRLINGDIHKMSKDGHTKIHFETYDLQITESTNRKIRDKSINSLTYKDLRKLLKTTKKPKELRKYQYEWHKRFALSFACLLFVLLGIGLGCRTNSRSGKSGGGVISVGVIVAYWIIFIIGNSLLKNPSIPVWFAAWLPAFILLPAGLYLLRQNWN